MGGVRWNRFESEFGKVKLRSLYSVLYELSICVSPRTQFSFFIFQIINNVACFIICAFILAVASSPAPKCFLPANTASSDYRPTTSVSVQAL